jgi:hypothetical protein
MKLFNLGTYIAGGLASAVLLAGCSTGGSQSSALGSSALGSAASSSTGLGSHKPSFHSKSDLRMTVRPYKTGHRVHRKSWMSPDIAKLPRLLFITDPGAGVADIFTMPGLVLKGQITGLLTPAGACSDRSGNIWITSTLAQTIQQYDRSGVLLNTLFDNEGLPGSCAVDPTTGNLAVVNLDNVGLDAGSVLIYPGATGPPTQELTDPNIELYFFSGYDPSGNLYVNGFAGDGSYVLDVSPAGSGTLSAVTVSGGTIFFPGMIQWNKAASDLVLGDQLCNDAPGSCLYSASVSGSTATITSVTNLEDGLGNPIGDLAQGVVGPLARMGAAGGSFNDSGDPSSVNRWHFPAGGAPTNFVDSGLVDPVGAALSTK